MGVRVGAGGRTYQGHPGSLRGLAGGDCECRRESEFCVKRETNSRRQLVLRVSGSLLLETPASSADVAEKALGHWEDLLLALSDEGF